MIETVKEKTKDLFNNASLLVSEYIDKNKDKKQFFFLQFRPNPTISTFELMKVMMLNNIIFTMYAICVTPLNSFFVTSEMYYGILSPELIQKHFIFLGSDTLSLDEAYQRINNIDANSSHVTF